jgi:hypothetical protein
MAHLRTIYLNEEILYSIASYLEVEWLILSPNGFSFLPFFLFI